MADQEREQGVFTFGDRPMSLYRPSDGQMFTILTLADLSYEEDVTQQLDMVTNFGVVVRGLFVEEDDRRYVLRGLASDLFSLEEYFDLARQLLDHWAPEQAANREERRAAAKAPAKKAAPAKRINARPRR
jgi:hypothetical protein